MFVTKVVLMVDNITTKVMAEDQPTVDTFLYDMLSTPVLEELKFTDSYQSGMTDGKLHVYNKDNHSFHSGLLEHAIKILEIKHEVTVIDNRTKREIGNIKTKWDDSKYKLRTYQIGAIRKAMKRNGIIQIGTGGGKTIIGARLIRKIAHKSCFIVHTRTLLYQTQANLSKILGVKVGIIGDSKSEIHDINVCSIQTLYAVLSASKDKQRVTYNHKTNKFETEKIDYNRDKINKIRKMVLDTKMMIVDESHHISAETYTEVARSFKNASWRFGLTATAWREDKKEIMLFQLIGGIIYQLPLETLVKKGYLVTPRIDIIDAPSVVGIGNKYSKKVEKQYFVGNMERNQAIINKIVELREKNYKSILVIAQFVDHVKLLAGLLLLKRIGVGMITGSIPQKTRMEILEDFENGHINVLVSTDIFGEGFDMPQIDAVVLAQMGKSSTKVFQYIGRALRIADGKDHALIVDIADRYRWFGQWFTKRLGVYAMEPIFRENVVETFWKNRLDLLSQDVDIGQDRVIKYTD